jgi:hypothetical protein
LLLVGFFYERIGLAASRIAISGNYMLRRPKRSKNEVVALEEEGQEEEEEEEEKEKGK